MTVDERYYDGFEGEDEVFFVLADNGKVRRKLGVWYGYISDILRRVEPSENGWEGIAYRYHVCGLDSYSEEKPWHIDDLPLVYGQLAAVTQDMTEYAETPGVLSEITGLLKEALNGGGEVCLYID